MRIAVIDDYEPDRLIVADCARRYLKEHGDPPVQLKLYCGGEEFIASLAPRLFDLVLLDCCMDGMDGLQTARELRKRDEAAALIFITSCQDYAIGGYLVSASGYLVKPYDYHDFSQVLSSVLCRFPYKKEAITVSDGKDQMQILIEDIVSCDVAGHYVQLHCTGDALIRSRMTFSTIASLLAPYPQFLECYRGCLINMNHACKAEEMNFLMDTGERVPFRKKEHLKLLRQYSEFLFDKSRAGRL